MPKVKFTKEDILRATYDIMKQDGIKNIMPASHILKKDFL